MKPDNENSVESSKCNLSNVTADILNSGDQTIIRQGLICYFRNTEANQKKFEGQRNYLLGNTVDQSINIQSKLFKKKHKGICKYSGCTFGAEIWKSIKCLNIGTSSPLGHSK